MFNYKRTRNIKSGMKGKPCGICGGGITGRFTIDHKAARSKGGSNSRSNLQPAHLLCNRKKGDK